MKRATLDTISRAFLLALGLAIPPVAHGATIVNIDSLRAVYDASALGRQVTLEITYATGIGVLETCSDVDPENVELVLTLPPGTSLLSESHGGGVVDTTAGTVTWGLGTLDRLAECFDSSIDATIAIDPSVADGATLQADAAVSTTTAGDDPTDNQRSVTFQGGLVPLEVFLDDVRSECRVSNGGDQLVYTGDAIACDGGEAGVLSGLGLADAAASVLSTGPPRKLGELHTFDDVVVSPSIAVVAGAAGDFLCDPVGEYCYPLNNFGEATVGIDLQIHNPNPFPVPLRIKYDAYAHASCSDNSAGFPGDAYIEDSIPTTECGSSFTNVAPITVIHADLDGGSGVCRQYGSTSTDTYTTFDQTFPCPGFVTVAAGSMFHGLYFAFGSGNAGGDSNVYDFGSDLVIIRSGYGKYGAKGRAQLSLGGAAIPSYPAALDIVIHSPVAGLLTDEQGRRVGLDPQTVASDLLPNDTLPPRGGSPVTIETNVQQRTLAEIPGGQYSGIGTEPQQITVGLPEPGAYALDLIGTGSGAYTVEVRTTDADGNLIDAHTFDGGASPGVTTRQTMTLAADGTVTLDASGTEPIPGDLNGDGTLDFATDFPVFLGLFGTTVDPIGSEPDYDGDGVVGLADYSIFITFFQ